VLFVFADRVDRDRHQERAVGGHQVRAVDRQLPLEAEVALLALVRVARDQRHEQRALVDLPADLPAPGVAAAQLALVEPHLDPGRAQRLANAARRLRILLGVAPECRP